MAGLIKDPEFNINRTEEYKLSIQISLNGFSFSVVNEKQKKLLALDDYPLFLSSNKFLARRFKEWINDTDIIRKKFRNTTLVYYPDNFTFIPLEFYDSHHPEIPGELVFGNQDQVTFINNYLQNASGTIVFPVPSNLPETISSIFPGVKLLHPAAILDNLLSKIPDKNENIMLLYFSRNSFCLLIYSKLKLLVSNCFDYVSPNDAVFYVLSVLKQIKLTPGNIRLFLSGEILPNGELHNNLNKFINSTIFLSPEIAVHSDFFKEPLHRFIILY